MTEAEPNTKGRVWPRRYLLQVYDLAIANGLVEIAPISQTDAISLTQSIYRLRRRSDASNVSFITPEHHLVTMSAWRPDKGGVIYAMFDKTPDGEPLPDLTPIPTDGDEVQARFPTYINSSSADGLDELIVDNVDNFVAKLAQQAREH